MPQPERGPNTPSGTQNIKGKLVGSLSLVLKTAARDLYGYLGTALGDMSSEKT